MENLTNWIWFGLGIALVALEMAAPGIFLFWLGLAAFGVGFFYLALMGFAIQLTMATQIVVFAVFSIIMVAAGKFISSYRETTEKPYLNRRSEGLVGRTFVLETAIFNGIGMIRVEDSVWRVTGPDMPSGATVRILRADGAHLLIEPA